MSRQDDDFMGAVLTLVAVAAVLLFCWWSIPRMWHWWVGVWQTDPSNMYCKELKKIVKADPLYEDNGKYEDEAYRVTYADGSVGLADNATIESGSYCVSQEWMTDKEAEQKGWTLAP